MKVKLLFWLLISLVLGVALTACTPAPTPAPPTPLPTVTVTTQATLLVYNTVEQLLAGDLLHTTTISEIQTHLSDYPPDWPLVGVGTTDWIGRNGEMLPDGAAGDLRVWWADPNSLTQADVRNLAAPIVTASLGSDIHLPFLSLAVGNPETAITWSLQIEGIEPLDLISVPDLATVQEWLP